MRTASVRIRLLVIAAVVALSVWAIYPPDQKIKLGLDLKGGVHLVLRVKTDDAPQRQTQATATALNDLRRETVQQALQTIERRVNELGVAEPVVALYGDDDRILMQLPGVEDVEGAKQIIKSTAQLRLTLVERGPFPSRAAALAAYDNTLPTDHGRSNVSLRAVAVSVRGRGPSGLRVHDARRNRERHVFHGVHRLRDCHQAEPDTFRSRATAIY